MDRNGKNVIPSAIAGERWSVEEAISVRLG
jgi:hypothetical protein